MRGEACRLPQDSCASAGRGVHRTVERSARKRRGLTLTLGQAMHSVATHPEGA